jgi:vacuolar-type H+-ATPase subunit H
MVKPVEIKRTFGTVGMLIVSLALLVAVEACSKGESEQTAAKPGSNAVEKAGDALDKVAEKTKAITGEAVKSAGEMVDKATDTAKDAYDAAGNAVEKTAEKAKEAYQSADRTVSEAINSGTTTATDMQNSATDTTDQNRDSIETSVSKALESVPSHPDK